MHDASMSAPAPAPRRSLLDLLPIAVAAATAAGWGGGWHWLLDLANHFRWYWLLLACVAVATSWRRTGWLARSCLAVALAGNLWALLPYWLPAAGGSAAAAPTATGRRVSGACASSATRACPRSWPPSPTRRATTP